MKNALQSGFRNRFKGAGAAALMAAVRKALNGNAVELAAASANVLSETDYTITAGQGGVSINPGIDLTKEPDFSMGAAATNPLSETQTALAPMITNQRGRWAASPA